MQTELELLLALQAEDVTIHGLEARLAAMEPRLRELDVRRQRIVDGIDRTVGAVTAEEKKQAYLRDKVGEHRKLVERNQVQMDAVKTMKQATAAVAQMETAKQIVAGEESDLLAISRRIDELRAVLAGQHSELEACEAEQHAARAEVEAERATVDSELSVVREQRSRAAELVPAPLRATYDRIRGKKRVEAVFAMHDMSCGSCDTAIPMQRRHIIKTTGAIDLCEACGVLMYFPG